jgi:hypothetical protein
MGLIEPLTEAERSRLIEMAWEDRTPFEMIRLQYGLTEASVNGRLTKHQALRSSSKAAHSLSNDTAPSKKGLTA